MRSQARHPLLADEAVRARLRGRKRRDRRFRLYCIAAIALALACLLVLFVDIARKGWSGFTVSHRARCTIELRPGGDRSGRHAATPAGRCAALMTADYAALWREPLKARFPVEGRAERRRALRAARRGGDLPAARPGARRPVADRPASRGLAAVVLRGRPGAQGQGAARRRPRAGRSTTRQLAWLDRAREGRRPAAAVERHLLHQRRLARPAAGGHPGARCWARSTPSW